MEGSRNTRGEQKVQRTFPGPSSCEATALTSAATRQLLYAVPLQRFVMSLLSVWMLDMRKTAIRRWICSGWSYSPLINQLLRYYTVEENKLKVFQPHVCASHTWSATLGLKGRHVGNSARKMTSSSNWHHQSMTFFTAWLNAVHPTVEMPANKAAPRVHRYVDTQYLTWLMCIYWFGLINEPHCCDCFSCLFNKCILVSGHNEGNFSSLGVRYSDSAISRSMSGHHYALFNAFSASQVTNYLRSPTLR